MRWAHRSPAGAGDMSLAEQEQVAAWSLYNAAAHGWQAPVAAVLIGPWMLSLAANAVGKHGILISVGSLHLKAEAYPSAMLSVAAIVQFLVLPAVGAAADVHRAKRRWLAGACVAGSLVCGALAFSGGSEWLLAGLLYLAGSTASGLADLLWNGMLPELAVPDRRNAVSGRATAVGYLGAGIILGLELAFIESRGAFGLSKSEAVRWCFLIAGLWWAALGWRALRRLNPSPLTGGAPHPARTRPFTQLAAGYRLLRQMPEVRRFVIAYLFFGDAISSVISLSSTFLTHQLFDDDASKASSFLFSLILMVQFVALAGALLFVRLARRVGTKRAVLVNLAAWFLLILFAYAVLQDEAEAVIMGIVLGLLLGGATALARSLFAQMIPRGNEATFFGLFEVCSQGTAWLAPLLFTVVVEITGSFHQAILSLLVLFVAGFLLLLRVNPEAAAHQAAAVGSTGQSASGTELG